MPEGVLTTVPVPVPTLETVKANFEATLNVAVTLAAVVIAMVQVVAPVHAPDHPANTAPLPGVAVSVTEVPVLNCVEQVGPQLMPAGLLVTVPVPEPALATVRVACGAAVKVAVTLAAASIVSVQVCTPLQAPDHPPKTKPLPGVAVRVTTVPLLKLAEQFELQLMPSGLLVTVPDPVIVTLSCKEEGDGFPGLVLLFPPPHAERNKQEAAQTRASECFPTKGIIQTPLIRPFDG